MPDNPRIEDLRRRVQKDPASIAFAQLAEEYRRAGQCREAVEACRAGLSVHPGYLSARVTLGRALIELGQLDEAQHELETVLKGAAENLAAIRGLAEIHHRRGTLSEALSYYRAALNLARNDPELQETVNDLTRKVAPARAPEPADGLSLEQMRREMAVRVPPLPLARQGQPAPPALVRPAAPVSPQASPLGSTAEDAEDAQSRTLGSSPSSASASSAPSASSASIDSERDRAVRTVAALEEWLAAVHAARADRDA